MKLKQQLQTKIKALGLSPNTFKTYWNHIESFLRFSKDGDRWVHPKELTTKDVERYLTHLAVKRRVTPNSQNCNLQAILFLYKHCLGIQLTGIDAIRAKSTKSLPVVYNRAEVKELLDAMSGKTKLVSLLMYGCGLRISEAISVRIKDFDFVRGQLTVRQGKGKKDRITCLPESIRESIEKQIEAVKAVCQSDQNNNRQGVSIPGLSIRRSKHLRREFAWYYLFPSKTLCECPETGEQVRHHIHKSHVGREIAAAGRKTSITKRIKPHGFRHSYATHMIESGVHIKLLSEMLGHASIDTTQIYLHCDSRTVNGAISPLDLQQTTLKIVA